MSQSDTDVLIVGAGPTGLAAANQLGRYGVTVRVIDRAAVVAQHTKALGVQARTLELLEGMDGATEEMVRRGVPVTTFNILSELKQIARFDLGRIDSPYPYLLMLPQNHVEQILRDRLAGPGIPVEHGVELRDFAVEGDRVDVVLARPDEPDEHTSTTWLVGSDGAHSPVRHRLDVGFEGTALEQSFAVADVRVDWRLPPDEVFVFLNRGRFVAMFPMADGMHRVAVAYPPDAEPSGPVTADELQDALNRSGPPGARLVETAWTSRFRINQRVAARSGVDRVLLAGDAAHVHSLIGAQGMNTGIQDALNLGWKLGMHLSGRAPAELVSSYAPERAAVARRLVHGTHRATRMTLLGGRVTTALRRNVVPLALSRDAVRRRIERAISQTDISYRESPLREGTARAGAPAPGDRAPDATLTDRHGAAVRVYDFLHGATYVLLCFTGDLPVDEARSRWLPVERCLAERRDTVVTHHVVSGEPDPAAADGTLLDPRRATHERYGMPHGGCVLVRPDGYIAVVCEATDLSPLETYLDRWVRTG